MTVTVLALAPRVVQYLSQCRGLFTHQQSFKLYQCKHEKCLHLWSLKLVYLSNENIINLAIVNEP
jgi:hypothetical protein